MALTARQAAAEAVCEHLVAYERNRTDMQAQLDSWEALWIAHKVWRAARAVDNTPTLEGTDQ